MCVTVRFEDGAECETVGQLAGRMPNGMVGSIHHAGVDPEGCLCQLDLGATAVGNGYLALPDGGDLRFEPLSYSYQASA